MRTEPTGRSAAGEDRRRVLVVGAGPAGSSLALRLRRRNLPVRILDARSFPRSKPCGDCLSPGATPLLRELGVLEDLRRHRPARLRGWRIRTPEGRWFEGRFSPRRGRGPPHGLALPRRGLDEVLLAAAVEAGAEFLPGRRVYRLLRDGGRVTGAVARAPDGREEPHPAALVVGADGLRSTVARRVGGVRRGPRPRLALVGRFRDCGSPDLLGQLRLSREGVVGAAPVGEGRMNVTVVVPARTAAEISRDRDAFFRDRLRRAGLASRLAGARRPDPLEITGPFRVTPRRLAGPGFLLVGDAAGYFDPLTGQGIYRALVTARLAARTIPGLLANGDRHRPDRPGRPAPPESRERVLLERYVRELERILGPGRRVQREVDRAVSRPGLVEELGVLLEKRPGLGSLLLEVTGDRLGPAALLRPDHLARACFAKPQSTRPGSDDGPGRTGRAEDAGGGVTRHGRRRKVK